ncbi:MAG: hypothetical protein JSS27_20800 [Planctomycetes bacterium]|nr:hypothetical protein [Planctomycetota bacterium]
MAKKAAAKPAAAQAESSFVDLMLVAAEFVQRCGGLEHAKKALNDASEFIRHAGSADQANKALEVLESLKAKIG